jgi:hypothetical protein
LALLKKVFFSGDNLNLEKKRKFGGKSGLTDKKRDATID